jgi:demethylmenaquinone methyltransferase/2-methoxy-6-polyprenyl-1,4-benzoquinol methylase
MPDATAVRAMFAGITPRYDLLNRVLSMGVDRRWRRRAVAALSRDGSPRPGARALDACCGTGDLSAELASAGYRVTGVDFCHEMLVAGAGKKALLGAGVRLAEGDALHLPFPDAAFSAATVAFGVRNWQDLDAGLRELRRVLEPGGKLAILEFGRPPGGAMKPLYHLYLNAIVPVVGRALSGNAGAYRYLATTIQAFPDQRKFPAHLERAGFGGVRVEDLTSGIAALYVARRL